VCFINNSYAHKNGYRVRYLRCPNKCRESYSKEIVPLEKAPKQPRKSQKAKYWFGSINNVPSTG
jgi:hypothetical protein